MTPSSVQTPVSPTSENDSVLWPARLEAPTDVLTIEQTPLEARGLPESTWASLRRAATLWPNRRAISVLSTADRWKDHRATSFAELGAQVTRAANLLHELGVRRDRPVGLLAPNCHDLIVATLAAEAAGVAAPINPGLNTEHVSTLLRTSGARILISAGPELSPAVWRTALVLAEAGHVDTLLALRPTSANGAAPPLESVDGVQVEYLLDLAAAQPADDFIGVPPAADDIAAVFHTGGTTGVPKLAAHLHRNQMSTAWMVAADTMLGDESTLFAALPLFHVNAVIATLLAPMLRGQHVVWAGPDGYRDPHLLPNFWHLVEFYGVATLSAVPTIYQTLAQLPVDANISSMLFAMVGASPLPEAVRSAFEKNTGVPLVEGYGLTEATCVSLRNFAGRRRPASVGYRLPYQQVRVVRIDEDGTQTVVETGDVGVLAIGGASVFPGYVTGCTDHGLVIEDFGTVVDGWLDTGDLARLDEDGFVYLTGRAKDIIIRGGHNIDPSTVEEALLVHPEVTAAAVVGRPDTHAGEVPAAFVTVVPGATVGVDELVSWAAAHVNERAAAPRYVTIVDAIPVTAVGKPYKLALRAEAARDALASALGDIPGVEEVTAQVRGGDAHVEITLSTGADRELVGMALSSYTVEWSLVEESSDRSE